MIDIPAAEPPQDERAPRLPDIPPKLRPIISIVWLAFAIFVVIAQVGGLWVGPDFGFSAGDLLSYFGIGFIATALSIATSALLLRRRPGDLVAALLAFSILSSAAYFGATTLFYATIEMDWLETVFPSLWLGLLVAALPAFPNGRYAPGWGRWLTLLALPFTLLLCADIVANDARVVLATTILGFSIALLTITASLIRFRRTPRGLERQQLKWAALGVTLCILLLISAISISYAGEAGSFSEESMPWVQMIVLALRDLSFLLLALGFLMALLRLRLWDADRVIGRSAGYFLLTLILACVFAVSSALVNDFVSSQVGDDNKGIAAALSTIIAALVFGPARERIDIWVEQYLQRGIVQVRSLPGKLAIWQHLEAPEAFGTRVAGAIGNSLNASRCAVLLFEQGRFRPLASIGTDPDEVQAWIAGAGSFGDLAYEDPADETFPLRLILTDEDVLIGALLLGRRSDGSFFAKEERKTLLDLEPALAAALNRVHTKVTTNRALTGIDRRLERVEEKVGTSA